MSHIDTSNSDTIAKDNAGTPQKDDGKKLPASTYGFPNHSDGIQNGDTTREDAKNMSDNIPIPPDGLVREQSDGGSSGR
jgi:hypothetical protein